MAFDRDRENSFGGFQYRWNYDEYQKSLQRKRKKSAARGMRAFCLTTAFVFLLCTASLLVVLAASLVRGFHNNLPSPVHDDSGFSADTLQLSTPERTEQSPEDTEVPTTEALTEDAVPVPEQHAPDNPQEHHAGQTSPQPDAPNTEADIPAQNVLREETTPSYATNLFTALTISEIAEECSASTVTIQCKNEEYSSIGSGFFLSDDGYLVTNNHVIRRYDAYQVLLGDGTTFAAELVSAFPETDLAVLKIDAQDLPVVTVGSSDSLAVGDQVVAIGTPGSVNFAGTVTYGYVSGLDRRVEITDAEEHVIGHMDMIQITAVINPGNSGGPLFNCFGEVIGINTMKLTGEGFEGMGFAIPIGDVYAALTESISQHRSEHAPPPENDDSHLETEPVETPAVTEDPTITEDTVNTEPPIDLRPYAPFGVRCETVTEQEAELYTMPVGVIIRYLEPDSYAEQNGLRIGDIILSIDGTPISDVAMLDTWAQNVRVGDCAEITVYRAGGEVTLQVLFDTPAPATEPLIEPDTASTESEELPESDLPAAA